MVSAGKAAVFRRIPFTIILKEREGGETQPIAYKVDPGSKKSGVVLVADFARGKTVIFAAEIEHRGQAIKVSPLDAAGDPPGTQVPAHPLSSEAVRQPPSQGRLASPFVAVADRQHHYLAAAVGELVLPITAVAIMELVKFDLQSMENPEISGIGVPARDSARL